MRTKKKILVFIDWYLPGYKAGGPIRSCANLVDHLKADFDFSIVTRDTDYCETKPYEGVESNKWLSLSDGVRVFYFSSNQLNKKNIQKILKTEEYDVVYLNGMFSSYFTLLPLYLLRKSNKPIIVASRGMLAMSALALKKTKKTVFLFAARLFSLFKGVIFHATNQEEVRDIQRQFGLRANIRLAGNLPKKINSASFFERKKEIGLVKLVNVARIAPEKNLSYALEVLQQVKGNVQFDFYGPIYDQQYWNQCQEIIKKLPPNIKANYKNSIESDKIGEMLKSYHFMFMPTQGENFGHIIVESFIAGSPVIISDQTMWRNLKKDQLGFDIPLAKKTSFVSEIQNLIDMDGSSYRAMSEKTFLFGQQLVNNSEIINQNKLLLNFYTL